MRLFFYYALHTFVNQLRKLFKTWVLLFFIACLLIGGLIGLGAGVISDMAESNAPPQEEHSGDIDLPEELESFMEEDLPEDAEDAEIVQRRILAVAELIAGGAILAVFVYEALSADKNGSRIFLPADVNILFASPMRPQSVLMFRLLTQLGAALAASIYLLFQLPNLMLNLGLGLWAALAVIATWCFTVAIGKLLQLLLYMLCAQRPGLKRNLSRVVYGVLLLLAAGYFLYWRSSGLGYLAAAEGYFNAPFTRFIPFWGWLKGITAYAMEGDTLGALLCLAAVAAGGAVLTACIWRIKADFYEDAMAKSEETAALLEKAQSEKSTGLVFGKRKKDRSDALRRDGLKRGWGANAFFYKTLYNRVRFAHLGVFTKTMEMYLAAALIVGLLCRLVFHAESLTPVALALAALTFFRSLGNPMSQDTKMDFFLLIPESTRSKLFYSLLGGNANCLLDVLPAMLLAAVLVRGNVLLALAWVLFIVSVDVYATTVATFIDLSVPSSISKTIKQVIQIMFIYFGLLPDIAILAVGLVTKHVAPAAIGAAVVNVLLGLLFFALCPRFLDPRSGRAAAPKYADAAVLGQTKKQFSRMGFAVLTILIATSVLQIGISTLLQAAAPGVMENAGAMWLVTFAPMYLAGVPLGLLLLRPVPVQPREKHSMSVGRWLIAAAICVFMMYAGNLVGTIVASLLQALLSLPVTNPVELMVASESMAAKILVMVILAPLVEEYVFRKQLIDRMHVYGEKLAVVTSALLFGLFHGNLSQLFYAFTLGLAFGYIYLKTGKLRYSVALHMAVNFMGSILAPALLERADLSALESMDTADPMAMMELITPGLIGFGVYALAMLALAIAGLVLLCVRSNRICFDTAPMELPQRGRFAVVWCNAGMVLLVLACLLLIMSNTLL